MKCNNKRTFFNVFNYYDCFGCKRFRKDEELIIEEKKVNIYNMYIGCVDYLNLDDYYKELYIALNKRIKLFLKDIIINNLYGKNYIYLWLDEFDLNNDYSMEIIYSLLDFDLDIHIIT